MPKYEVIYDCSEDGCVEHCVEYYEMRWDELSGFLERLKVNGGYNITVSAVCPDFDRKNKKEGF